MTEKERFAHHVRADFPGQADVILAKVDAWDAEIAWRRKRDFSRCSQQISTPSDSQSRQTTFEFGPREHWPHK